MHKFKCKVLTILNDILHLAQYPIKVHEYFLNLPNILRLDINTSYKILPGRIIKKQINTTPWDVTASHSRSNWFGE